ncbi:MAG TPA: hypothetical protein VN958_04680 [Chitinophagaceae bacterium]|nr:hypothetical protein [Chitinophagaceae bacterium]
MRKIFIDANIVIDYMDASSNDHAAAVNSIPHYPQTFWKTGSFSGNFYHHKFYTFKICKE